MLRFIDLETPANQEEDVQIAGLRPLPINRMRRQAGREANQFYTRGQYGKPVRGRDGQIIRNSDGTPELDKTRSTKDNIYYDKGDGQMPADMKERLIKRHQKANEAIENWDPIEASAQEDTNRLRGGRRGPIPISPLDAMELIQPIAPLDKEPYTAFPGV